MRRTVSRDIRLPEWFRRDIPEAKTLERFRSLKKQGVNTVCLEAACPNWCTCLKSNTLTFMILGDRCTRNCRFCAVKKSREDLPAPNSEEPRRILNIIKELGISFVILTCVTRDDLEDYGAGQFVCTIAAIRDYKIDIGIEILIPDFIGVPLRRVVESSPNVLAHNIETVPRLYTVLRQEASYQRSLQTLAQSKELNPRLITKSSLLLGMGENEQEVVRVMNDLLGVGTDILVLGQYLAPTHKHHPVKEFICAEQFSKYRDVGLGLGFKAVVSFPLARTSYEAQEVYEGVRSLAE